MKNIQLVKKTFTAKNDSGSSCTVSVNVLRNSSIVVEDKFIEIGTA